MALNIAHYFAKTNQKLADSAHVPTTPTESEILTIREVSEYLKVTERTIYRLAASKKIPAFKVGGAWRFSRAEIDQWIKRQAEDSGTPDSPTSSGEGDDD